MKRALAAALLTMLALAACASPLAKAETPQQALDAAAQRASQLKSAKFDLQGSVKMTFPAQLGAMLGQSGAGAGSISLDMSGTGEAQFPDRYHAVINAKMSGMSIATEVVVATLAERDALTGIEPWALLSAVEAARELRRQYAP